jgi:hypothetical protein
MSETDKYMIRRSERIRSRTRTNPRTIAPRTIAPRTIAHCTNPHCMVHRTNRINHSTQSVPSYEQISPTFSGIPAHEREYQKREQDSVDSAVGNIRRHISGIYNRTVEHDSKQITKNSTKDIISMKNEPPTFSSGAHRDKPLSRLLIRD